MNALNRKLEDFRNEFVEAMKGAQSATDEALEEFLKMKREDQVRARYARMYVYRLEKAIKNLGHAPSLAVSSERDATKDDGNLMKEPSGAWSTDFDIFDENDGETEAEKRMWAARDSYDMREGK